ncbi:MAG: hypothetical protein HY355_06045 [Armatimonadetes bacterium]|nr:hypothetical protein [Armatimonadota bacterium]
MPFSRYALHFHRQRDGSRGSRVASVAIYDGAGDGIHAHDSYGVLVEDVVVYNQGRAVISDDMSRQHGHGIYLEASTMVRGHNTCAPVPDSGAREWRIDRPLVMKWGPATGCLRCSGIWLGFGPGAYVLGAYASGGRAVGIHWCEGCGNPGSTYLPNEERVPRVLRATASGNLEGFFWWTNQTPEQAIVDLLSFGNNIGFDLGAYSVRWWVYGPRAIGNRQVQFLHHAAGTRFTGFLADGRGNGSDGIWIAPYSTPSSDDTLYEAGVIRGTGTAATFEPCLQSRACGSELTLMQFNRVIFTGNPLLRFVNHPNVLSTWRIRDQAGLTRPGRFTLYHPNRVGVGGVYDTNYIALRVDNDSTSTLLRAPRARWSTATGCARDEDAVGDRPTLCLATDARTVEFYVENNIVATVLVVAGIAATRIDLSTWPHRRAYVYARAIGTNGRSNYSRVLRLISNP